MDPAGDPRLDRPETQIPLGWDSTWMARALEDPHIPGSSFGRKKVPDLNPANFSAGFRKKRRRPEKTSGSKILKNRDDKRLDHTQANCLCATSSLSRAHSFHNPTLEPSRSHCPRQSSEWPKSRTITKYWQTCAQAKTSKKKTKSMWQGTPLSLQPCL